MSAPYATPAELRQYLPQVESGAATDSLLASILERAASIVEGALGFSYDGYSTSTKTLYGDGSPYLALPPHEEGSITAVAVEGDALTDYVVERGHYLRHVPPVAAWRYTSGASWLYGTAYTVTASWGRGYPPAAITQVVLEVAVNIWRSKDAARFSDVVGVEGGGAVGYEGALTRQQAMIIANERARWEPLTL